MRTRRELEVWIDYLIDLLDEIDGDADHEPEDLEHNLCSPSLDYVRKPARYDKTGKRVA